MEAAPGIRSVVGDDGGGTGDLDSATLEMTTSAMRHRGPGQCNPGDDIVGDAAQGTVKQCSPGYDDVGDAAQGTVKQCSPGDDDVGDAAHGTVKQCSPGDDLEAAQGTVSSPGDNLEAAQGTVKQCSPGDDLEAAHRTVKQCSPGEDIEAAQGTENGAALVKTRRGLRQCSP
ncbi:hypothetical protein Zmor_003841 [Zophobas morio]|uniref:Uncharacterized protein n=1 Tax=Zophobas morio TaxID=2755281 RepID=A0AA38HM97_9CUCU|nr:hypothetical protein Zmor_003841 [Zophobas morio]